MQHSGGEDVTVGQATKVMSEEAGSLWPKATAAARNARKAKRMGVFTLSRIDPSATFYWQKPDITAAPCRLGSDLGEGNRDSPYHENR
jgi:hypothetical protein